MKRIIIKQYQNCIDTEFWDGAESRKMTFTNAETHLLSEVTRQFLEGTTFKKK